MHRQNVTASPLGGLRFRAAPWWLAALGAADAIGTAETPAGGALGCPTTPFSTRFSHHPSPI